MYQITLPQAVPVVLPPMGNYLVSLLKDTSIASLIAAPELMLRSRDLAGTYYLPIGILFAGRRHLFDHGVADDARRASAGTPLRTRSPAGGRT